MTIIKDFINNHLESRILVHLRYLDKMNGCYNYYYGLLSLRKMI